jgi:hypothetical protein
MRRFTEFINTASDQLAKELISQDAVFHVPGRSEPMRGPAGYLAIIGMMREGFPDIQWTLEEMVAEGDKVAARFTMRGPIAAPLRRTADRENCGAGNDHRLSAGQFVQEHGSRTCWGCCGRRGPTASFELPHNALQSTSMKGSGRAMPLPNQRMKLTWRGGRLKENGSILLAAAAPRSLCALR